MPLFTLMKPFSKKARRYWEIVTRETGSREPGELEFQLDFIREAVHRTGEPKRHHLAGYGAIVLLRDLLIECVTREPQGEADRNEFRAIKSLMADLCLESDEMRKWIAVGVLERLVGYIDVDSAFSDWESVPELARALHLSRIFPVPFPTSSEM